MDCDKKCNVILSIVAPSSTKTVDKHYRSWRRTIRLVLYQEAHPPLGVNKRNTSMFNSKIAVFTLYVTNYKSPLCTAWASNTFQTHLQKQKNPIARLALPEMWPNSGICLPRLSSWTASGAMFELAEIHVGGFIPLTTHVQNWTFKKPTVQISQKTCETKTEYSSPAIGSAKS